MSDFKNKNIERHKELFDLSEELESIAEEIRCAFNDASKKSDFRPSKIPLYKTLFLYFINTAMRQFPSIHILCKEGYAYCAAPVLRSLLENLISIKFILLNDDNTLNEQEANSKAHRFEEYRWINMSRMLRYWKNNKGVINQKLRDGIVSRETEILNKVKEFKKIFKTKNLNSWSGFSIEQMAEKVDMSGDYNLVYRLCCTLSHPSSLGHQLGVDKNPQKTIFSPKPTSDQVISVLEIAITYFHAFLFLHDYLFSLGKTELLKIYQLKAKSVFDSEKYKTQ